MKNLFYQPRFFLILSIFFLTLFISPTFADAATYYVATNGNDSNPGTQASPWKTVVKGCNTVTTAGDTIHIVAGTYTESAQCFLAKGVNIEGEGKTTTIVKSTLTGLWSNYMELESPDGTNGSQSISNFTLDGNTNTSGGQSGTGVGIWITGRSNVSVHDMKLTNFYMSGTIFGGNHLDGKTAKNWTSGPYATGNTFYNNDGTNCAAMEGSIGGGSGCLMIGWQDGMQIHHNNLNTTARPVSHNGWPIKFLSNGYLKGVKIHDNTLIKSPFQGAGPWAPPDWDFAIEFFNVQGLELANNYIQGSVDVNYTYKGSYPYGLWAHGNTHNHAIGNYNHHEAAYVLEFKQDHVIIENNIINNKSVGITYNTRGVNNNGGENNYACTYGGSTGGCSGIINNVIRNNVFSNIYLAGGQPAPIVVISENEVNDLQMDGMHIYNNVISGRSGAATYNGIEFNGIGNGSSVKNVYIRNNIIQNFQGNPISVPSGGSQSNIHVTNNDFYNNASNAVSWPAAAQANNQTNINPLFVSATDFHLQATSPLIDDGFTPLALPSYAQAVPFNPTAPDLGAYETGTTSGNASPVANAGPDQAITLPTSTVTLTGTGTDSDGTITAYAWTKTAGPTAGTITNPASASTTVTGLAQGTYTFQLQVTDNLGATGIDTMNVVVSGTTVTATSYTLAGPTGGMVGSASTNFTITPNAAYTGTITVAISGGGLSSITKTFSNSSTPQTFTITPTVGGVITLTPSSNPALTNPSALSYFANQAPVVNAGLDKTITLPVNNVSLTATATDPNGDPMTYLWTKVSGPASGTIATPTALTTNITNLTQGTYTFWMTATDSRGASGADQVVVIVNGAVGNASPVANAGPDQAITLPTSTVTLTGTGTDSDGTIASYLWTKASGPTAGTITNSSSATTTVTGLAQGTYTFQLQVTDNLGATGIDTMNVVVSGVISNPGNFATWNPLDKGAKVALSNNNMTAAWNGGKGTVRSTISKSSGKWYWEVKLNQAGNQFIGVATSSASVNNTVGWDIGGWSMVVDEGDRWHNGSQGYWAGGPFSFNNDDVVGVALDIDNGKIAIYKNGAYIGEMFTGITGNIYAAWGGEFSGTGTVNFGATPFIYAVPAGYNPGLYGSSSAPVFGIGTKVKTLARVAVRAGAGNNFVKLGIQQKDAVGTIIDGPANGSGYTWWKVDFDNAPDGWVQKQYLGNY